MTATAQKTDAYWMPYTANRDFKKSPRIITGAAGHHYTTADGSTVYDMFSGLWTSGVGHGHPKIVEAVQKQVATLDYCMQWQCGGNGLGGGKTIQHSSISHLVYPWLSAPPSTPRPAHYKVVHYCFMSLLSALFGWA